MSRKYLAVATAPFLFLAGQAMAETVITDTVTASVRTSTVKSGAADDILVDEDAEFELTTGGPAIVVDSNNTLELESGATIDTEDVDGSIGIQINGGVTTNVTNSGAISLVDSFDETDDDNDEDDDGDLDGDFATGTGRYGIRVGGAGAVEGVILNDLGGSITIEGNDSFGMSLESALNGDFINRGAISVLGDNAVGMNVAAPVTGMVEASGSISVQGENAVGVAIDAAVDGRVHLQGSVISTGYRYTSRSSDEDDNAVLDEDDLLQGGGAVKITADVTSGILLDTAPVAATDTDGDGVLDTVDDDLDGDGIDNDDDDDSDGDGITDDDYGNDGKANSSDDDDDNDGIDDDDDDDDNGDGIPDDDLDQDGRTGESTASLVSYGAAPALLIGSDSNTVTVGKIGTGEEAYGLVIRGSITGNGVFDDISATGLKIGGLGYATTIEGGINIDGGTISSSAYNANSQAVHLGAGAVADAVDSSGTIYAWLQSTSAPLAQEDSFEAVAVRIDAGASVSSLVNSGSITAAVSGENSDAIAIRDSAGTVSSIVNSGTILAYVTATDDDDDTDDDNDDADDETVNGRAIAIDVRNALQGVSLVQYGIGGDTDDDGYPDAVDNDDDNDGILDADDDDDDNDGIDDDEDDENDLDEDGDGMVDSLEPAILGDVLFGAHDDILDLRNGTLTGDVSFGDGADTLNVGSADGYADMYGAITDSDGQLDINVINGALTVTNAETINATSLTLGATSTLTFTADPQAGGVTSFAVSTATLESGAQLRLEMESLIDEATRFTVISTDPGGLSVTDLDTSLDEDSPYIFVATASSDASAGEVYLDVRRRTAAEIGLSQSQTLAFDAVYAAISQDEDMSDSFLSKTTQDEFMDLYEQMLPDQGEGLFSAMDSMTRTVSRLTATRPNRRDTYGPDSFWIQEVNSQVMRDAGVTAGSTTKAFGFVGGYESMGRDGGALGATLAFVTAQESDDIASVGEETSISLLEAGIYWRRSIGKFTINARGAAGYAWLDGDRVFVDSDNALLVEADSEWTGVSAVASMGAAYEIDVGRFYARPNVSLDYLYFKEGVRQESGGNDGFDQTVQERTSSRLSSTAALTFGANYGRDVWWRPELTLGYRQHLAGEIGDTVFRFSGGEWVSLPATEPGDGSVLIGLSLKAGTPLSYMAIEGEYEAADGEDRYNLNLAGRFMF